MTLRFCLVPRSQNLEQSLSFLQEQVMDGAAVVKQMELDEQPNNFILYGQGLQVIVVASFLLVNILIKSTRN